MKTNQLTSSMLLAFASCLLMFGCKNDKPFDQSGTIVFDNEFVLDSTGREYFNSLLDHELVQGASGYNLSATQIDSLSGKMKGSFDPIEMVLGLMNFKDNTITFSPDSIIVERKMNFPSVSNKTIYDRNTGARTIYSSSGTVTTNQLSLADSHFVITREDHKTKRILGYNCHFVKITSKLNDDTLKIKGFPGLTQDFGEDNYELWVTNDILLPGYVVINGLPFKEDMGFPMEGISYGSALPGFRMEYKVTKVDIK